MSVIFSNRTPVTNARIESLMADFSGLSNLEDIAMKVLKNLALQDNVQMQVQMLNNGDMSMQDFDGFFAELVRVELGKTLGIIRNKAVQKANAGSASSAVYRRMYKDAYKGNVNILGNRGRISSKKRYDTRTIGGKSGIIRERSIRPRTEEINSYYGPDRHFILRFLNEGTDVRVATPEGPTGKKSRATWGNRSNISKKGFFDQMQSDMEQAAQQLGTTLIGKVGEWLETKFTE